MSADQKMPEPMILGFDTSAGHCAAALLCGDRVLVARAEEMTRGQAERLMPLLEEVLHEGGCFWRDLMRIGVGVGPGNFTGIRISVAAARGLALGLDIAAIGVTTFDAVMWGRPAPVLPVVPGPRDQLYVQRGPGQHDLVDRATPGDPMWAFPPPPVELAVRIARIAAASQDTGDKPAPFYLKPADAAPARDAPPVLLD